MARKLIERMTIVPHDDCPSGSDDALLDLLARYDTSRFAIDVLTLNPLEVDEHVTCMLARSALVMVGTEEGWPLAVSRASGDVWLIDPSDFVRRVYRYAASGSGFLEALVIAAQYERPHLGAPPDFTLTPEQEAENDRATADCADRCARAAGLREDEPNPYRGLLGLVE